MGKRSRWDSAIAIQIVARAWLARRRLTTKKSAYLESLEAKHHNSVRVEAALLIQCMARQWRARRRVAAARQDRDSRQAAADCREVRNQTDPAVTLFSVWDLPDELVDFQAALAKDIGSQLGSVQFPASLQTRSPIMLRSTQSLRTAASPALWK